MTKINTKFLAICIVWFSVFLAISSVWDDSIIVDEVPHIGAGYSYLVKQDMRLNPEHPPLAKDLAAIPLLFLNLKQSVFETKQWLTDINGQWEFGRFLIFNAGNDADQIKHFAKIPMLIFFIFSAILIFQWTRKLYGNTGALMATVLFSFSPTVLAHTRFVTTDVPALFGIIFATYFFIRYLKVPTGKNLIIAGVAFGIALITKFSTFLLIPFLGLTALIFGFIKIEGSYGERFIVAIKHGFMSVFVFFIGLLIIVWPVYYLHVYNYPPERQKSDTEQLLNSYGNRYFADPVVWAADKPIIRALDQYFLGLLMVTQRATGGNTTYFLGEVSMHGWHKYFPIVYFIKEPLAWWGLVIIALLAIITKIKSLTFKVSSIIEWARKHFEELAMLLWIIIYWTISVKGNLNIGGRHLLPVYPFTIILVSGQLTKVINYVKNHFPVESPQTWLAVFWPGLIGILLSWYVYENLNVYPYYLTYFNQVAGGPTRGYRYVVDSNLDWGQDLLRLKNWLNQNSISKIEFDYFGWADPSYYLKEKYIWINSTKYQDANDFINRNNSDGWIAVSSTFLQGSQGTPEKPNSFNYERWLKAYEPITVIGNSIFVYRISK